MLTQKCLSFYDKTFFFKLLNNSSPLVMENLFAVKENIYNSYEAFKKLATKLTKKKETTTRYGPKETTL